jgi:hypothetical protein
MKVTTRKNPRLPPKNQRRICVEGPGRTLSTRRVAEVNLDEVLKRFMPQKQPENTEKEADTNDGNA